MQLKVKCLLTENICLSKLEFPLKVIPRFLTVEEG